MNKNTFILLFSALFFTSHGQIPVTFQLDLGPVISSGAFSPEQGVRVYVRGTFNSWEGNAHELNSVGSSHVYRGTYVLNGEIGDTVSFKYIIDKEGGIFWEYNPAPDNPDHGNRVIVLQEDPMVLPITTFHQNEYFSYPVIFSKEKLKKDFQQFRTILEETHPALYDYTEKGVLDSVFDCNYARIDTCLDLRSFLLLMTEAISLVGCGHSSMWIPGDYWKVAPRRLFPLKLSISNGNTYISGSYTDGDPVPPGSELLSINRVPVASIISRLENLTSADAFNASYRQAKVEDEFSVKYAIAYGFPEAFSIEYLAPGMQKNAEKILQPVSKEEVDRQRPDRTELSFKELEGGNAALLTINTFSYYSQVEMFHHFIDSVFSVVRQKEIGSLLLDLRGNNGGDPFCASYLWAYLQPESLPYFEKHYGQYDTLANPVPLPANHFTGQLYTLIDGRGFSTTGHFCGLLKYHSVGRFVGEETGATYTCTGNATYPPLKNTRIMVGTARVTRYTAAVRNMDPMQGIIPDYPVEITQQDIIEGRDAIKEHALRLAGIL